MLVLAFVCVHPISLSSNQVCTYVFGSMHCLLLYTVLYVMFMEYNFSMLFLCLFTKLVFVPLCQGYHFRLLLIKCVLSVNCKMLNYPSSLADSEFPLKYHSENHVSCCGAMHRSLRCIVRRRSTGFLVSVQTHFTNCLLTDLQETTNNFIEAIHLSGKFRSFKT